MAFLVQLKQILGPFYFVRALVKSMACRTSKLEFFLKFTREKKQTNKQKEKFYNKPETFPTKFGLVTSHNKIHLSTE